MKINIVVHEIQRFQYQNMEQFEKRILSLEKIINILLEKNNIQLTFCPECGEQCDLLSFCNLCKNTKCTDCLVMYTENSYNSGSLYHFCKDCVNKSKINIINTYHKYE